ncbi:hypothetical protein RHGRI_030159 [Rhododendron griersonianum]|uniref:Calmodulin-binding heat-shock protein n=1 Tax=Rhododendron griersonianum TaxID=479676 RepID=A0AAV6IQI5_9ERIC|nr:hypothetical protein RHGRI_030159 [Rhododendron griersonianum]
MSVTCGMECVVVLGCLRWAWKRCTYIGSYDSATWTDATAEEFEPVPRVCRVILAAYEDDLSNPKYPPVGGYKMNPDWVIKRVKYEQTQGHAPPYLIYADHDNREIVLAIRGLNLVKDSDYKLLLNNRLGMQKFDGGYVHYGLLKSATWLLNEESETLRRLWVENGSQYRMIFAGHSLGSGVAALMTVIVVNHLDWLGGIPRSNVRCYAVATARYCIFVYWISHSKVFHNTHITAVANRMISYQEQQPLWKIYSNQSSGLNALDSLPCLLFFVCLRDTFIPEGRKLRDPRRLCGRFPPEVRTAIPVDGRFEHIVLSCNTTLDHGIIWIEKESEKALNNMRERNSAVTTPPKVQKIERFQSLQQEHKDALERAVSLNIPHAVTTPEEEEPSTSKEQNVECDDSESFEIEGTVKSQPCGGRTNWNMVVEKLLKKDESGELLFKKDTVASK